MHSVAGKKSSFMNTFHRKTIVLPVLSWSFIINVRQHNFKSLTSIFFWMHGTNVAEKPFVKQLQQLDGSGLDNNARTTGHQQRYVDDGRVMIARILSVQSHQIQYFHLIRKSISCKIRLPRTEHRRQRQETRVRLTCGGRITTIDDPVQQVPNVRIAFEQQHNRISC